MTFRLVFAAAKGQFTKAMKEIQAPVAKSLTEAFHDIANQILNEGRNNIRSAEGGQFTSKRWIEGFQAKAYPTQGWSMKPEIYVYHKINFARVFEAGTTISGKPLLWIPLPDVPKNIGTKAMNPRLFVNTVAPLHPIIVPGKPLMLGAYMLGVPGSKITLSKLRAGRALGRLGVRPQPGRIRSRSVTSVPLFIGIPTVRLRARFGLNAVYERARAGLGAAYLRRLSENSRRF